MLVFLDSSTWKLKVDIRTSKYVLNMCLVHLVISSDTAVLYKIIKQITVSTIWYIFTYNMYQLSILN